MENLKTYTLKYYLKLLAASNLVEEANLYQKESIKVLDITYNSKEIKKDALFICKGLAFKQEYLEESVRQGAFSYVSEKKYALKEEVPYIIVKDIRKAMAILAGQFFDYPQNKLNLIGIGGTKGKTTTAFYMKSILDEYMTAQDKPLCGIMSSIHTFDGKETKVAHNTTPEAVELYRHLYEAVKNGVSYMVMEVSSQALKYNRVDGLVFDVGVFLNISKDHISPIEHKDFKDYFHSKLKMFTQTKTAVVNLDIEHVDEVLEAAKASEFTITYSLENEKADYLASNVRKEGMGSAFGAVGPGVNEEFQLSMPGLFNVENAMAAIAVAKTFFIPLEYIKSGLKKGKAKGRMEIFKDKKRDVVAIVDYAHNKLSFERLFSSMKEEFPGYRIVAVFGTPGGKAFDRREELGRIAGKYADYIILTADEPGFESVEDIANEIAKYIEEYDTPYEIVVERRDAVKKAILESREKTLVIVAGKGHEDSMKVGNKYLEYPSDIELVTTYLNR